MRRIASAKTRTLHMKNSNAYVIQASHHADEKAIKTKVTKKCTKFHGPINKKCPNFLLVGPREKFLVRLDSHKDRLQLLFWNIIPATTLCNSMGVQMKRDKKMPKFPWSDQQKAP